MNLRIKAIITSVVIIATLLVLAKAPALAQDTTGTMDRSSPGYSRAPGTANPGRSRGGGRCDAEANRARLREGATNIGERAQCSQRRQRRRQSASLAQQAESKKIAAVKAEGLQPQQYNQVLALVQSDKSLAQRFLSYVDHSS